MKHAVSPCHIHVGKHGVKHPPTKMWAALPKVCDGDPVEVKAETAFCKRCGHTLDRDDLFERDLTGVTCSNCYSDNIMLTSIRYELWDKKDWEECKREG